MVENSRVLTFVEVQREMQVQKVRKQGVTYAFRNAEEICTRFKEIGSDFRLIVVDELVEISGRLFVRATARCFNDTEDFCSSRYAELSPVPTIHTRDGRDIAQMQPPQWTGAVSSYAGKYALQGLFAIGERELDELPNDAAAMATADRMEKDWSQVVEAVTAAGSLDDLTSLWQEHHAETGPVWVKKSFTKRRQMLEKAQPAPEPAPAETLEETTS